MFYLDVMDLLQDDYTLHIGQQCNKRIGFSLLDLLDHLVDILDIIPQYLPLLSF